MLEAQSFIEDFKQIGLLFDGQVIDFVLNFIIDSFRNTISAFVWPATVVQFSPPWGAVGLGLAFWLFPVYIKKHIEAWMFADDEPGNTAAELTEKKQADPGPRA